MSTAVKENKAIGVLPYKWLGGKRWALKFVQPLWNWYRESTDDPVYQDLTVGGGALPLLLGVEDAELSDASAHLIASWKWLKRSGVTSIDFRNTSDEYYQMRTEYNRLFKLFGYSYDGSESQRRALGEMFWHLNRSSRSGIWRVNRSDEFNVPFGDRKKLSEPDLQSIHKKIQGWKFQHSKAEDQQLMKGSFLVFDPPYCGVFDQYTEDGFSFGKQVQCAGKVADHDGPVIAFNSWHSDVWNIYEKLGFRVLKVRTKHTAKTRGNYGDVFEMFALKGFPGSVVEKIESLIKEQNK